MTTGLARTSLRARPAAAAGVFSALVLSATVITASVAVLVSASGAPASEQREELSLMGVAFTLVTIYLSIFVIAQVTSLAVSQRRRETALLRAIGAGPWQVRRMVAVEALLTAVAALPVGYGLGVLLARWWFGSMTEQGLVPPGVRLTVGWPPALAAAAVLLVTSLLGGLLAAWRSARSRPAAALGEAAVPGSGVTVLRVLLALGVLAGAVVLRRAITSGPADRVAERIPLLLLAHLVAIGLAGPLLGRLASALAGVPFRLFGALGELAVANSRARSRRLSAAITPVTLVVAFALAKLSALAGRAEPSWIDLFGTALYAGFAALVAANTLVMLMLERRREVALLRLVGACSGQLIRMLLLEGVIVSAAALGLGALVAGASVAPMARLGGLGPADLPADVWAGIAGAVVLLVMLSSTVPLVRLLTVRPAPAVAA
ncbi:FtsX-like permease family protein [Kitasatospora sp. NPDC050543]|uniref:ABC transporter permease n=1 Tax=Kitasatospora sp. NPDC050543 TaxID=3364054 RepID=UPI0037965876